MVFADRIEKTLTIPLDQLRSGKLKKKSNDILPFILHIIQIIEICFQI